MRRILTALLVCAAAHAATSTVALSVTATLVTQDGTTYTASGPATLTGGIAATGTFNGTATVGATGLNGPFTVTLPAGTLSGSLVVPLAVFESILGGATSGSGVSATIASGTGTYAGDTGSFPSLSGSGSLGASGIIFTFSGNGTISTGGTVGPPSPTITAVLDAASNTANLGQGTIFIVKGTTLCASSGLQLFSIPRPTVAPDGVKITFTPVSGGSGTNALLWYEDNLGSGACQLAGILQSTVAPGSYNVTVTNGTTSAPFQTTVVKSKVALFTQDSTGGGLASAQDQVSTNYYLNRLTTGSIGGTAIAPAYPGEYMVAYGTGLGAVTAADDNDASPIDDFSKTNTIQAVVGGISIPVLFAGRAGYAGEDQINFQLPANVPTGCAISLQLSVNGTLSPATTLAIAPSASAPACVQPGLTAAQLTALDNGGTINSGSFSITQIAETAPTIGTVKIDQASGGFTQVSGSQIGALPLSYSSITQGSCTVFQGSGSNGQLSAGGTATNLDAGTVTLGGPAGTNLNNTAMTETNNSYLLSIGDEGISIPGSLNGTITAGKYTLAGAGGKDVGSFNTSITLGTPLSINGGLPAAITRSTGLVLTWTGGNATDPVIIIGSSGTTTGSGANAVTTGVEFVCTTTAGTGGFTVPASVLTQLPASSSGSSGFLDVGTGPASVTFSPSLTAGGTVASMLSAILSTAAQVTYQ